MSIALVQQNSGSGINVTSVSVTLASAIGAGNVLIASCRFNDQHTVTVTGGGTTFTKDVDVGLLIAQCWSGVSSGSSAAIVVGVPVAQDMSVNVSEWSGFTGGVTAMDPKTNFQAAATSVDPGTTTPTAGANAVVMVGGYVGGGTGATSGPTGGFTALTGGAVTNRFPAAYQLVASASGGYTASWGQGGNNCWSFAISYIPTGAAAALPRPIQSNQAVQRAATW